MCILCGNIKAATKKASNRLLANKFSDFWMTAFDCPLIWRFPNTWNSQSCSILLLQFETNSVSYGIVL